MKQFTYKVKSEGWAGTMDIMVPNFKERLALAKELRVKELTGEGKTEEEQIDTLLALYEKVKGHINGVDLMFGEFSASSLDDLEYAETTQLVPLIAEVVGVLANGISVGKSSPQQ